MVQLWEIKVNRNIELLYRISKFMNYNTIGKKSYDHDFA